MAFNWTIPPWQRNEDSTHMAVVITDAGGGRVSLACQGVRGEDAFEALADLLMGPGGGPVAALEPAMIGVVVRRGIDVMWMAQPPIEVTRADAQGQWTISVDADGAEVTAFWADDARDMLARLRAEYGAK